MLFKELITLKIAKHEFTSNVKEILYYIKRKIKNYMQRGFGGNAKDTER